MSIVRLNTANAMAKLILQLENSGAQLNLRF